jgi:chromosome segregation ATPase
VNRLHKQLNSSPVERDKLIISQKDRDIRELTTKMEEMADELAAKDRRIERLREEMSGVEGELQRVSLRQNLKEDRQALDLAQESLQQLQREHRRVLEQYENVKQLN